jgi:hypothetical protein
VQHRKAKGFFALVEKGGLETRPGPHERFLEKGVLHLTDDMTIEE